MTIAPSRPPALRAESDEVFYAGEPLVAVGAALIDWLKLQALQNPRKRSRLCTHVDRDATVHEMLIVHHRDVYVRPHRHLRKAESFHRIEGTALIVFFDERGALRDVFESSATATAPFYLRIPAGVFHMFLIQTPWLVFHETTAGPFVRAELEFAPWSPADGDANAVAEFTAGVEHAARAYLARRALDRSTPL